MNDDAVRAFRDRFNIPISDADLPSVPFYHPGKDSPEVEYMLERRKALGGFLPQRRTKSETLPTPGLDALAQLTKGTGEREISTTMAFVRGMNLLLRDKVLGPRIVPIVADEARTFGMEGMFRQIGIYAPFGQKYKPMDADQLMFYHEDQSGQVLQQGISEPGAFSSWMAAATSYSISNVPMLPFYIYYSMFGFQRIGDLAWAAGDMRARGEGLQHEDGHSHLLAGAIPNCHSYDPTFSFEVGVILQDGVRRMLTEQEDCYYYVTLMNENYAHPDMPAGVEAGIIKGMYLLQKSASANGDSAKSNGKSKAKNVPHVQLMGSGTILREVIAAAELLEQEFGVSSTIWSCPSFNELRRDGFDVERWNRLHPMDKKPRQSWVAECLEGHAGPVVAATDYVRAYSDQIRAFIPEGRKFISLGTDGYGRSDSREALRGFFEVDRYWIAHAAISALAAEGKMNPQDIERAIKQWKLDPEKPNPTTV